MKKFIKSNIKLVIGIIVGAVISGFTVYATTIAASNITYDKTNSIQYGATQDTAQGAITELYSKANTLNTNLTTCQSNLSTANSNYSTCSSNLSTKTSQYNTCSSNLSSCQTNLSTANSNYSTCSSNLSSCQTTLSTYINPSTIQTNSTGKIFASSKGIVIRRNGSTHFLKTGDWSGEQTHIQQVFQDISCEVYFNRVICSASDFKCEAYLSGLVRCYDKSNNSTCQVPDNGNVTCD